MPELAALLAALDLEVGERRVQHGYQFTSRLPR